MANVFKVPAYNSFSFKDPQGQPGVHKSWEIIIHKPLLKAVTEK